MTDESPVPIADTVQHAGPPPLEQQQLDDPASVGVDLYPATPWPPAPTAAEFIGKLPGGTDVLIIDDPVPPGGGPAGYDWQRQVEKHTAGWWRTFREEQAARLDQQARAEILGRLDVDPWRVPTDGLLAYDPVHDEWRVELFAGDDRDRTVIVRRYAGRKTWRRPPPGVIDLSPYIAPPHSRVWFRPDTSQSDPPSMADLQDPGSSVFAQLVERHRRLAQAFRSARRMPAGYARGGRIRPSEPDRGDQVDAMAYAVRSCGVPPSRALADLVDGLGTKLAAGAAAAAGVVVHINTAGAALDALRPELEAMKRDRRERA